MEERRQRSSHLRRLSSSKRMKWHETFIGKSVRVLLENPKNGFYGGYTENYLKVIVPEKIPALANLFAKVKISEVRPEYCLGEILSVDQ
jgi:tRNA A37 methylthiotransferase MiaB